MGVAAVRTLRRVLAITAAVLVASSLGAVAGAVAALVRGAPGLDELRFDPKQTTFIYDRKGRLLARLFVEHRIPVRIDRIPRILQQAVIAAEDSNFERHRGVDLLAILRALWVDIREGTVVQGGSTITQQLAKNAFLSHERTLARKIREAIWAIQLERRYTKEEILEAYLNEIFLGESAYGVEAASQTYFGKSVEELTLAEAALLAGIAKSPANYSPFRYPERARARRNYVLDRMVEEGYISPRRAAEAKAEPIQVVRRPSQRVAPYFVEYVLQELERSGFDRRTLYRDGLRIYTTLDLDLQRIAEKVASDTALLPVLAEDDKGIPQPQLALVALDPHTGDILAMVGGRSAQAGVAPDEFNRAVLAVRQPGSAIKPFIWTAAIDRGIATPASVVVDERREYPRPEGEPWRPQNYDNQFLGPMSLREALERSRNLVAIQLLEQLKPRAVIGYAERMGIQTLVANEGVEPNDVNLALALGGLTRGVRPIEMAAAYAVFASGGVYSQPRAILRVEDASGVVLRQFPPQQRVVLSEQTAYLVTDMMRGVLEKPYATGRAANLGRPAAGKTGTTQEYGDAWFVGFTPDLVAAVWFGFDVPTPMTYGTANLGSSTAARIWKAFMSESVAGMPPRPFPRPPGIVTATVDVQTGLLAPSDCGLPPSEIKQEIFKSGTEPKETSPRCRRPWFDFPDWLRSPLENLLGPAQPQTD